MMMTAATGSSRSTRRENRILLIAFGVAVNSDS